MEPIVENTQPTETFNFDFSVLADFCRVRNRGNATTNGNTPPPRVQFLLDLCQRLGLNAELDVWVGNRFQRGTNLENIIQFSAADIDQVVDGMDHLSEDDKTEEKRVLAIAFANFDSNITILQQRLRTLENNRHASKAEIRIYKMMIRFKTDIANTANNNFYNIYIKGTSRCAIMAHHDIVNPNSDNCNDNSASCINVIAAKLLNPSVHVIINDAEEIGGLGAERSAEKIKAGEFGELDFVLNLELTAVGGKNFFVEKYSRSNLFNRIIDLFPGVELYSTPFHDGIVLRRHDIDSVVINPLPRLDNGELKYELLSLCHSNNDTIRLANYQDMYDFVTEVVTPIIDGREAVAVINETNAPLDTFICEAVGLFSDDSATLRIVEHDGKKVFELKSLNWKKEIETSYYNLKLYRYVYQEWQREKRFSMKVVSDTFKDYTYI